MSEPNFDDEIPYSASFPLPFRVLALVGLGILGWATNLHGLDKFGIDAAIVLELRTNDSVPRTTQRREGFRLGLQASSHYKSLYRLAGIYFSWVFGTWFIYLFFTQRDPKLVDAYGFLPGLLTVVIILVLLCPFEVMYKHERDSFILSLRRCLFITMDSPVYFADVVFADVLTSYAKVLGDVFLIFRMLYPGNSMLVKPVDSGWIRWLAPTVMSLPFSLRLRQCVIEWTSSNNESNRPLYNALKYATAFPVIFLSTAQNIVESEAQDGGGEASNGSWHGEHPLFRLWLLAAVANSLYSYWWDVSNDWGLHLFNRSESSDKHQAPKRFILPRLHSGSSLLRPHHSEAILTELNGGRYPYGFRAPLLYPLVVYPVMIFLNFVLRMTWTIKLSSHLHSKSDGSMTLFLIEVAEIFRRWMWVFFRVEWEAIKRAQEKPVGGINYRGDLTMTEDVVDYELFPPTPEEVPTTVIGLGTPLVEP